ncbi:ABC transporter ATP-binding protein [Roseburia sp. AM59-24XD]|jgi:ATP-binding cassette subfamily B multidrug efflux pump|uniref:ABC transporter ATP-binding protein n=1 Tax=Roseburia sp. AM59-24XD TaxID=2293138 RepID=UPI000E4BCC53|nr:ABC transporter ATP-binding protein [Roseburia sp. AM59-24XD]RHP85604.1 ABC transporter ATP-binding protein [Roseburia sp. AM59-24XD]
MIKLFKNLRKQEWGLIVLALVFVVAQVWLDLTIPDYMADITRLVQTDGSTMNEILTAGGKMLLCALGSLVSAVLTAICAARIATSFAATIRGKLFSKVQSFSMEEIGHFSTASLITRSTNDVTQIQMLIAMGLQMLVKAPIMAVWAIMKISDKKWQWTFSTAVAVVVLLLIVGVCLMFVTPKFKKIQSLTDDLNRVTRENLTGLSVVRAYNAEKYQEDKFENANEALTGTNLFAQRTLAFMMPGIQIVMSGLTLAIYWIGAVLINDAGMVDKVQIFSDMMVFSQYAIQVVMSFMMLVMIFMILPRASVAANRIQEVLDTKLTIEDGSGVHGDPDKTGEIVFDKVSFRYPDAEEDVLKDISFTAGKGETVALIGATGCGKSTVINLIPRFYDATEGTVSVDGVNVKDYSQKELRNKIGYVSQKATLFTGTIESNVAYGDNGQKNASETDIKKALDIAQASEFVDSLEDGSKAYVAQGGSNFSGGQKQRMSIARAIARKPEILIFDDSFSALDYKTDRVLREALAKSCKDSTRIVVAQRIGTIRDADRIIVLEDGKIAGMGRHEELMRDCEVYRQIALSQLSKEELA